MTTNELAAGPENALLASQAQQSIGDYFRSYLQRLKAGDLGILPILIGMIIIIDIFQGANSNFLTSRNFVNLILQMTGITVIGFGLVFILLLGEIDLSVGYVSAVAGVTMTILLRPPFNFQWYAAVAVALLAVLIIGTVHGTLITSLQLPSFIVTLAGLLAWNGVVLQLVGAGGTIRIQDPILRDLASTYLPDDVSWVLAILFVLSYVAVEVLSWRSRKQRGLSTKPMPVVVVQIAVLAVVILGAVAVCNQDRGVPVIGAGMILLLMVLTFLANNTRFGRYVYAVGGNKEAARRAGIRVEQVRVLVFVLASFMAGLGGIVLASRPQSVATNSGGGSLLLNSIAAVVIGGTSLFGGRGHVSSALLGALIIASVENGMVFLGVPSSIQFIITGCVLLLAVAVDAISRRGQRRSNLAVAYGTVWFLAGFNFLMFILAEVAGVNFVRFQEFRVPLLSMSLMSGVFLLAGIAFVLLGYLIRRRSKMALRITQAILVAEGIFWIAIIADNRGSIPVSLIMIVAFLFMLIHQGYSAIDDLNKLDD